MKLGSIGMNCVRRCELSIEIFHVHEISSVSVTFFKEMCKFIVYQIMPLSACIASLIMIALLLVLAQCC
jgi:hypothetical protein